MSFSSRVPAFSIALIIVALLQLASSPSSFVSAANFNGFYSRSILDGTCAVGNIALATPHDNGPLGTHLVGHVCACPAASRKGKADILYTSAVQFPFPGSGVHALSTCYSASGPNAEFGGVFSRYENKSCSVPNDWTGDCSCAQRGSFTYELVTIDVNDGGSNATINFCVGSASATEGFGGMFFEMNSFYAADSGCASGNPLVTTGGRGTRHCRCPAGFVAHQGDFTTLVPTAVPKSSSATTGLVYSCWRNCSSRQIDPATCQASQNCIFCGARNESESKCASRLYDANLKSYSSCCFNLDKKRALVCDPDHGTCSPGSATSSAAPTCACAANTSKTCSSKQGASAAYCCGASQSCGGNGHGCCDHESSVCGPTNCCPSSARYCVNQSQGWCCSSPTAQFCGSDPFGDTLCCAGGDVCCPSAGPGSAAQCAPAGSSCCPNSFGNGVCSPPASACCTWGVMGIVFSCCYDPATQQCQGGNGGCV